MTKKGTSSTSVETHWMVESGVVDLFLFLGPTQGDVFNSYTKLTGRPQLPQDFAIAYHQCRWNYNTQDDVAQVDATFDENDIPYDVLWLDIEHTDGKKYFTWDYIKFSTPEAMQNSLSAKSRKMVTIIDPHIKKEEDYYVSKEANALSLFVKNQDGTVFDGFCWPGDSNWLDYTDPAARKFWSDKFAFDQYKGSTPSLYTWNDMNEPSVFTGPEITMHKHLLHHGGVEHRDVHNAYGMLQHRSTFEGHLHRSGGNDRPFILSRAFFAGTQRYGAIWVFDPYVDWRQRCKLGASCCIRPDVALNWCIRSHILWCRCWWLLPQS
jgi:mannosyl-oligosaccharide alpha-1,3-glucosidase